MRMGPGDRGLWCMILTLLATAGCGGSSSAPALPLTASLSGTVMHATVPIAGSSVTLYAGDASGVRELGSAGTGAEGNFSISYVIPSGSAVLYVLANGGRIEGGKANAAIELLSVLGSPALAPNSIVVNELTTVASAYAMAQFIHGGAISGPSPGLENAAQVVRSLVDDSGALAPFIYSPPNGAETGAVQTLNSMADIVADCVGLTTPSACDDLFAAATVLDQPLPVDTLGALVDIARSPASNIAPIFALVPSGGPFTPVFIAAPNAWTLAIKFTGFAMAGPGGMAFDGSGNMWTDNNFLIGTGTSVSGNAVTKIGPDGTGNSFTGGGLDGPAYGIMVDQNQHVWVGNYTGDSISEFSVSGAPISPAGGFADGSPNKPQGMALDQQGNIWIPNSGNDTMTEYPGGDHTRAALFGRLGLNSPFDTAVDAAGDVWVSNTGKDAAGNSVAVELPAGSPSSPLSFSGGGLKGSKGIAADANGNIWVANSDNNTVTELSAAGINPQSPYSGGGVYGPWGIAVDGKGIVWVANFLGQSLSELCGANTAACPPGFHTGQPISPPTGFNGGGALEFLTAVAIDQSGNVWVANNVITLTPQYIPGDGVAEFIGLAAPVSTPMAGPPRSP